MGCLCFLNAEIFCGTVEIFGKASAAKTFVLNWYALKSKVVLGMNVKLDGNIMISMFGLISITKVFLLSAFWVFVMVGLSTQKCSEPSIIFNFSSVLRG